jgi:hypothetical protein
VRTENPTETNDEESSRNSIDDVQCLFLGVSSSDHRSVGSRSRQRSVDIDRFLVSERQGLLVSGKAFSFVAMVQNLDVVIGTIACVEIYRASLDVFIGLVFVFAVGTRVIALLLIL